MKRAISQRRVPVGPALGVLAIIIALVGTATAAVKITSKDIKNGTVRSVDLKNNNVKSRDIQNRQIRLRDLRPSTVAALAAKLTNPQWAVIDRNTIGSAVAELRGGPVSDAFGAPTAPPFGEGSLGLRTSDEATSQGTPQEKVPFGNEVDFVGDPVSGIAEVGFHVFTTGENVSEGEPMPNITFEIDPNLDAGGDDFSSMVFSPEAPASPNQWSDYIDATSTGEWYLTGTEGGLTGCMQGSPCTFADLQTALDDGGDEATIHTVAMAKGRDSTFSGAVDGFRLNDTVYDFEPFGVIETPAS